MIQVIVLVVILVVWAGTWRTMSVGDDRWKILIGVTLMYEAMMVVGGLLVLAATQVPDVADGGYSLPLNAAMLALMPFVAGAVGLLRKVPVVDKNRKWILPVLSVGIGIGLAFLAGLVDPVQTGIGIGIATCYAYDLTVGVVKTAKGTPTIPLVRS